MLNELPFIIFRAPETTDQLYTEQLSIKKCKFALGSYNTKLASNILQYNGVIPTSQDEFHLLWATSTESDTLSPICRLQKFNHFPYSKQILGNKAELAYIIQNHPEIHTLPKFFPKSYILPNDRDSLFVQMKSHPRSLYISKPPEGSCGKGISIVSFQDFYTIHHEAVVSEYVGRPLTIDNFKFDMRIYVLVTSFAPLRAFIYKEGLARFATESYNIGKENVYSQLTNATLNKRGRNWCKDFKWKLSDLLSELEVRFKLDQEETFNKIMDVVAKTLAIVQPTMAPAKRVSTIDPFFELYGFDILMDRNFDMWLLEINTNPSMSFGEPVDYDVKGPLLANSLSIVGIPDLTIEEIKVVERKLLQKNLDDEIVRLEDERNLKAGNGFIRLYPSELTRDYEDLLVYPVIDKTIKLKKQKTFDPAKLGHLLSNYQAIQVLIGYLIKLEKNARIDKTGSRKEARLLCFLAAQGYKIKGAQSTRKLLRSYIASLREQVYEEEDSDLPETIEKLIMNAGEDFLSVLISNCDLPQVNNVDSLFI